jgi:hypothetical protein
MDLVSRRSWVIHGIPGKPHFCSDAVSGERNGNERPEEGSGALRCAAVSSTNGARAVAVLAREFETGPGNNPEQSRVLGYGAFEHVLDSDPIRLEGIGMCKIDGNWSKRVIPEPKFLAAQMRIEAESARSGTPRYTRQRLG